MVTVEEVIRLSEFGNGEYDSFPESEQKRLKQTIENVDDSVFI